MYLVDSRDKEYRHGDHGPKYLMKGPRSNFGLCQLRPGEVAALRNAASKKQAGGLSE